MVKPLKQPNASTHQHVFGELRSLLQETGSPDTWNALMRCFENYPDTLQAEDIKLYVEEHIERWSTRFERLLSPGLLRGYLFEFEGPAWLLDCTTGIYIDDSVRKRIMQNNSTCQIFLGWSLSKHIDSWIIGKDDEPIHDIEDFLLSASYSSNWTHLKRLHIVGDYIGDEALCALHDAEFPNLETLKMGGFTNFTMGAYQDDFLTARHLPQHIKNMNLHIERTYWDEYTQCWE